MTARTDWRAGPTVGPATYRLDTAYGIYVADVDNHTLKLVMREAVLDLDASDAECPDCEWPGDTTNARAVLALDHWRHHWFTRLREMVQFPTPTNPTTRSTRR